MAQEPTTTDPQIDPPAPPASDPPADPPASSERDVSKLPAWVQAIITDLQRKEAQARDEAARRRIAEREAEQKRLLEQGEFQKLSEQLMGELNNLRAEQAKVRRLEVARKVAKEVLGSSVADHDPFAEILADRHEDESQMRSHAERLKASIPRPTAPSTEAGTGRRPPATPTGASREEVQAGLVQSGTYPGF